MNHTPGFVRHDVTVPVPGADLAAWWYQPTTQGPWPTVVMAHGLVYYADVGLSAIGRSQLLAMAQEAAEAEQKRAAALAQERRRCQPVLAEISRRRMKNEDAMAYAMRYNCETLIVP